MNIPQDIWFAIALILLGIERLIPTQIPPWVAGVILLALGLAIILS